MLKQINPLLMTDFYKIGHVFQYPAGTEYVYSNLTPRKSRNKNMDSMVFFGLQYFVKEYLIKQFNDGFFSRSKKDVVAEYKRRINNSIGPLPTLEHIEKLHDLGYLPLRIKALREGTAVPMRMPCMTIVNTKPEFYWLTNFIESLLSNVIWQPSTSATIAKKYREVLNKFAKETGMPPEFVQWQGHDFSYRGMSSPETAMTSGMAHLLSFTGTDTIVAIDGLEQYYGADCEKELVGGSVPATEHSVMCAGGPVGEINTIKRLINDIYPNGIVSIVSDTWDLWKVVTDYMVELKDDILKRDGKVVIRPDSGDPVDILCGSARVVSMDDDEYVKTLDDAAKAMGEILIDEIYNETPHGECGEDQKAGYMSFGGKTYQVIAKPEWNRHDKQYYYIDGYTVDDAVEVTLTPEQKGVVECLWDVFGGTTAAAGYKLLDSHIGTIYGDSITIDRATEICQRLKDKGFASQVVFGIGSFTYQCNTRDTFGTAMKATYAEVNGVGRELFKDPKTDDGTKRSAKGLLYITQDDQGNLVLTEQATLLEERTGMLEVVFEDGRIYREQSCSEIRSIIEKDLKDNE